LIANSPGLGKSDTAHDIDKIKENGVFILCIHCIRMVYIVVASYSSFARLLSPESGLSFAAGICRTCANFEAVTEETYSVPYKILENTRMYLCACIVAREELQIAEEKNVFVDVALNDPGFIDSDCQVYEVRTDEHTLSKLEQLDRDKLLLEHVSGGFF
jgi:GTP-binding nuclear protein Ran